MTLPSLTGSLRVSSKLRLLILFNCVAFLAIAVIVSATFSNIERLSSEVTQIHLARVIDNSKIAQELTALFNEITLLSHTFFERNDILKTDGTRITSALDGISGRTNDSDLHSSLISLSTRFSAYLKICQEVNASLDERDLIGSKILKELTSLEMLISKRLIESALLGRDTDYIDQVLVLIAGYRESLLLIDKLNAEQKNQHLRGPVLKTRRELIALIDDLYLRIQTITASSKEIAFYGKRIATSLIQYRGVVSRLSTSLDQQKLLLNELEASKHETLVIVQEITDEAAIESEYLTDDIAKIMRSSGSLMVGLSILIMVLIGALITLIIRRNINIPLQRIIENIRAVSGSKPDNEFSLGGNNEWGTIEKALEQMRKEISESYSALQESESKLRLIIDHQSDLVVKVDPEGRFLFVNRIYCETFGKSEDELLGSVFSPLKKDDIQQVTADAIQALDHPPYITHPEQYVLTRNGWRWLAWSISSVRDDDGRISAIVGVGRDVTEQRNAEKKIQFLAQHDALTGLPNRVLVRNRFELAVAQADRAATNAALLFLDLDHFKDINDALGHQAGDRLLQEVVKRLQTRTRKTDTVSRQGGDEFLVVLPDSDEETAGRVAQDILDVLRTPFELNGSILHTTFSIGISIYPNDGHDFNTLLKRADTAMYSAKEAGRNTYRFFAEAMNRQTKERLQMQDRLRTAFECNELELHYQPQIELSSGCMVGVEALLRWHSKKWGTVSPGQFIPVAEANGLIIPIGEWVLIESCRQASGWLRKTGNPLSVSVNLSAIQFRHGNLVGTVENALNESGLPSHLLELELTESVFLRDTDAILSTVKRLKKLGVRLSIDDFGTGYSSLSYLKLFPMDRLKIDRSFICDMAVNTEHAALVRAIIQMAHSLKLGVVAEGVEEVEQANWLRYEDCEVVQGFLFSRPVEAGAILTLLEGEPKRVAQAV